MEFIYAMGAIFFLIGELRKRKGETIDAMELFGQVLIWPWVVHLRYIAREPED